ncbi:MAG: FHA domain-containing protein [Sulfuricellaceae bacterium]|nr:FHA domain-containing protein [Sulfuricellaceae bacterium]
MSKLIIRGEDGKKSEFVLDKERVTIGRKPSNDIVVNDSAVSGLHATIITLGKDSFLEDQNSTNGTQVNRVDITRCVLHNEDEIKIAHVRITFIADRVNPPVPPSPSDETQIHPSGSGQQEQADPITLLPELTGIDSAMLQSGSQTRMQEQEPASMQRTQSGTRGTVGRLRIKSGPGSSQLLELTRPSITLGKPGIQVVAITQREGIYYLGMIEGDELPLINEADMKSMPCRLHHGDTIRVAGILLEFTMK